MLTELQAAEAIRDGLLDSPQQFGAMWLFALRITGTGAAYRVGMKEYCWRDPALYLCDEFLARCNGLPVIWEHPEKGKNLDSTEFADRIVGTIMLPYIKGDEVWGIARIYDAPTITLMRKKQLSTSPSVVFGNSNDNTTKLLDDGSRLLVEGEAVLLDHLAICDQGVWDKGGDPAGVDNGGAQVAAETEEELKARKDAEDKAKADAEEKARKDAEGKAGDDLHAKLDKIMDCIGTMNSRMDALESAKKDSEAEEKAKKDAEEKARMDSETKARLDAMEAAIKPRADSEAAEMAEEQGRADAVFSAFGQRAKPPLLGETASAYRARLASELKQHSAPWKGIDLFKLPGDVLTLARDQIYNDAQAVAASPIVAPEGRLIERRQKINGAEVVTFHGSWDAAFAPFRVKPRKYAGRIQQGAA